MLSLGSIDLSSVRVCIPEFIKSDHDFFLSSVDKFTLTIIDDCVNSSKIEPEFGSMIPKSLADIIITDDKSVVVHYVHIMCHKKCKELWKNCPVPYHFFKHHEIDFIEEMYNQRLISEVAPELYDDFYQIMKYFDEIISPSNKFRPIANTVLTIVPNDLLPRTLLDIHQQLYLSDPLMQNTFDNFITSWFKWLKDNEVREFLKVVGAKY